MTLQELLKSQGLDDDKIKSIMDAMKTNKIYTASEENLDIRYNKLKTDHENLTSEHKKSTDLIAELQKATKGQEDVQSKITQYEQTIKDLQAEALKAKTESEMKIALLSAGAKSSDIDYLMFKAGADLELGEDGKIKGIGDKIKAMKTQFPAQFDSSSSKKIEEKKLDQSDDKSKVTKEAFAKMGYQERLKLYNDNPDQYKVLTSEE